jgi:HNH endonuclease
MLLDEATFQRFGYHLAGISPRSHKAVVCLCPACEQLYETQRRYHRDGRRCTFCTDRRSAAQQDAARAWMTSYSQQCEEAGISPKRLPLIVGDRTTYNRQRVQRWSTAHPERAKERSREAIRRRRQTLLGKAENRLRVSLRKALRGKGGLSLLPYKSAELQAHIQAKLEERQYLCPMCAASLEERFDIDHRIPLSSAKTVEEAIALFALSNLDVLCPSCNQHKKGKKHIVY